MLQHRTYRLPCAKFEKFAAAAIFPLEWTRRDDKTVVAVLWMLVLSALPLAGTDASDLQRTAAAKMRTAIEKQQASVRRQQPGGDGFFISGWLNSVKLVTPRAPLAGDCDPLAVEALGEIVNRASAEHGVAAPIVRAVIAQESGGRPCVVSPKGAQGLMQLMPATQADLGVTDPFDPAQNVNAGAAYLRQLLDRYKQNLRLALAAYNAGPGRVDEHRKVPAIAETQDYVDSILSALTP
jgi:hypothetical protein